MKTILIVGNFSLGALEHQYVFHLKNLGWIVYCFELQAPVQTLKNENVVSKIKFKIAPNSFYSVINEELLSFIKKIKPLATLVFKGMEIYPDTLLALKIHTKLLCNYNPDHPFNFYSTGSGNNNVKKSISHYDLYGTYSSKIAQDLKTIYDINSFILPFGYDANIKQKRANHLTETFGFIGSFDKERQHILAQLIHFPIEIYGDEKWDKKLKKNASGKLKTKGKPLFNKDYANYCYNCLGIFNFLRPQNLKESSHNMRTFEVPGYGGLLISNRTDEQLAFFEEGKEAIYFDSIEELKDKLSYLLANLSVIENLKKNAYSRTMKSNYSYYHRIQQLNTMLLSYV